MPRVAALYRYPVKGFTPEECETLTVLDEGRIVESGTHAQLMDARGVYRKLYELQFRNGH